jgi:chromosome segregation ATPase
MHIKSITIRGFKSYKDEGNLFFIQSIVNSISDHFGLVL